jgi:hypothetical protein
MNRKSFLRAVGGTALFMGIPNIFSQSTSEINDLIMQSDSDLNTKAQGTLTEHKVAPLKKTRVGIIGLGNRGETIIQMFDWLIKNDKAEIIALSDLREAKVLKNNDYLKTIQKKEAQLYFGNETEWQKMVKRDDIDLIVICTPWENHAEMSIMAMENGKHVACEVPIAYKLEDCWKLIEVAERTKMHCMMMENCNYDNEELWILNMINEGVFGELNHAEGAYIHDLRGLLLDETYYENQWRLKHHQNRNGNFYTTHGLGPISAYMGIGRGDNYDTLYSLSSREYNLSEAARNKGLNMTIKCGDMNTTLIKTKMGRTIKLQYDVHTGRPYNRLNILTGSKAVHEGYPSRLYIEADKLQSWGHEFLEEKEYKIYREKYDHPLWNKLKKQISENEVGHGGMDFVMIYRLIECLNQGLPLDINVYDSVMWSAITPLSELSVAKESVIKIPDFTGDTWQKVRKSEFLRNV